VISFEWSTAKDCSTMNFPSAGSFEMCVATLEEAKAQFQKSWDAWKAWAKLEEVPGES
jgi:hypothetical protein